MIILEKEKRLKIIELGIILESQKRRGERENSKLNPKKVEGGNNKEKLIKYKTNIQ